MLAAVYGKWPTDFRNFYFLHFQCAASVCLFHPHYIPEKLRLGLAVHLHPQTTPSVLVSRVPLGRQALSGLPFCCHCLEIPHAHVRVEPFMLYWALQMGSPHTPGLSVVTPGLRISLGVHSF